MRKSSVQAMTSACTIPGNSKPLIIFCHGSGDTGRGARLWIESLVPSAVYHHWDWIFPNASSIPYTLNGGLVTSIWYDRVGGFAPTYPEQTATVEASTDRLLAIIDEEVLEHGRQDIIIGGFSMGGNIAYQTAARWQASLGKEQFAHRRSLMAVFGLSCYLNDDSKAWSILDDSSGNPMCHWPATYISHGASDDFISPQWGEATYDRLKSKGVPATFRLVQGMYHDMGASDTAELLQFLSNL